MRISDWSSDVCSSDLRGSRKKATWRRLRSSQGHPLPPAVATAASPLQRRLQQPADESLRARCLRVVVGVRGFVHVDALAGFQLHRFDAIARIAGTAGGGDGLHSAVNSEEQKSVTPS